MTTRDDGLRAAAEEHPYCHECGSEELAHVETYANGSEYLCKGCGHRLIGADRIRGEK